MKRQFSDRLIASVLVVLLLLAAAVLFDFRVARMERRNVGRMASDSVLQRDLGVALARATLAKPNIVPLYGSSELLLGVPNRASDFFRRAPNGFKVCPIGRQGASSLLLLEKAAAQCRAPACGKAVISISQIWFLSGGDTPANYVGNYSALQTMEVIFKAPLSAGLRRDIARRMLKFPATLARTPILERAVRATSRNNTISGRVVYSLLLPLGLMQTKIMEIQDHFESIRDALAAPPAPDASPRVTRPDWDRLLAAANAGSPPVAWTPPSGNQELAGVWRSIKEMPDCSEWEDLELLVRTFRELGVRPLLLDIPWFGPYYDSLGVTAGVRDAYYSRLRSLAARYQVPLVTFQDHEYDLNFLFNRRSHLSAKGWIYFDRDIDAYWHGLALPDR